MAAECLKLLFAVRLIFWTLFLCLNVVKGELWIAHTNSLNWWRGFYVMPALKSGILRVAQIFPPKCSHLFIDLTATIHFLSRANKKISSCMTLVPRRAHTINHHRGISATMQRSLEPVYWTSACCSFNWVIEGARAHKSNFIMLSFGTSAQRGNANRQPSEKQSFAIWHRRSYSLCRPTEKPLHSHTENIVCLKEFRWCINESLALWCFNNTATDILKQPVTFWKVLEVMIRTVVCERKCKGTYLHGLLSQLCLNKSRHYIQVSTANLHDHIKRSSGTPQRLLCRCVFKSATSYTSDTELQKSFREKRDNIYFQIRVMWKCPP